MARSAPPLYVLSNNPPHHGDDAAPDAVILCQECGEDAGRRPHRSRGPKGIRQKACWGCATCEDFVTEPSIISDIVATSRRTSPGLLISLILVVILVTAQAGSSTSPSLPLLPFSLWSAVRGFWTAIFTGLCLIFPILIFNAVTAKTSFKRQAPSSSVVKAVEETSGHFAELLSKAIQLKTVSHDRFMSDEETDYGELKGLHKLLEDSFPLAKSKLQWTYVNKHSIVIKWLGSDKSLKPIMLCAHLDVVAAPNDADNKWEEEPFSGLIKGGEVWGRGAIDNKHNVIGQMGAVERLLEAGFEPSRTVYLAFGHDEEISGHEGAKHIAEHMKKEVGEKGIEAIFDEGPMMVEGALPGMKGHVGLVANSEKGFLTLEMSIKAPGGHSSMPPLEQGTISIIADAVNKLDSSPCPAHFTKGSGVFAQLEMLCPLFTPAMRVITANLWLFAPLMKKLLLKASPAAAAMLRTTTAITVIKGGTKSNVLPYDVKFIVNHRVHPDDTLESIVEYDKNLINNPPRKDGKKIEVKVEDSTPPSPISSLTSDAWRWIEESVGEVFNNPIAPSVMVGNTDTRWYWDLSDDIYRFSPVELNIKDVKMFHGLNERISVKGMGGIVQYYEKLIKKSSNR